LPKWGGLYHEYGKVVLVRIVLNFIGIIFESLGQRDKKIKINGEKMAKKKNIDNDSSDISIYEEEKRTNVSQKIRDIINKSAGKIIAHNLEEENPTIVKDWIPTGSRWLDSIVCNGKMAGIPVGKISEICGTESSGKSYMAAQIAANAIKKGIKIVYFDSESAIDPEFLEKLGVNINDLIYIQAESTEFVLESIEKLLAQFPDERFLFIFDSIANCATKENLKREGFDPQTSMAFQARVVSLGFKKLTIPLANSESTLLVINQLRTNLNAGLYGDPWFVPSGKALAYACSLIIYLTASKSQKNFIHENEDDEGDIIGTSVKATIKKSRFGSYGRVAEFNILWSGEKISIQDEMSWLEVLKSSHFLKGGGAGWWTLKMENDEEIKFQGIDGFMKKIEEEEFRKRVLQIMDDILIYKKIK